MSAGEGKRAIVAALPANLGIAVTKFVAFLLTLSSSMLAESIHSVADSGNQALLLLGGRRSRRAATPQHPFGYGRERYIYAFIVSIVLFSVGGLFALYEAYHKFLHPEGIENWQWVPVVVLVVAIGLESYSFRTAIKESNVLRGDSSWIAFIRRAKAPGAAGGAAGGLRRAGRSGLRAGRRRDDAGHRQRHVGRRRHRDDRLLLVAIAIILAVETKSLLLGEAGTSGVRGADRAGDHRRAGGGADHPHEDAAPGPGGAAGRREDRGAAVGERPRSSPGASTRSRRGSGRPYRSPG